MKLITPLPKTPDEFKTLVKTSKFYIEFIKSDGELRKMNATTNVSHIVNEDHHPKGTAKTKDPNNIAVYDLDKLSWRSFNISKLQAVGL